MGFEFYGLPLALPYCGNGDKELEEALQEEKYRSKQQQDVRDRQPSASECLVGRGPTLFVAPPSIPKPSARVSRAFL